MSESKNQKIQELSQALTTTAQASSLSLKGLLEKLPNWALLPLTVVLFGLLLADTAIPDPVPLVDEAALFYALISSMRVLGGRRKAARAAAADLDEPEIVIDVEAEPLPARPTA